MKKKKTNLDGPIFIQCVHQSNKEMSAVKVPEAFKQMLACLNEKHAAVCTLQFCPISLCK